MKVRSTILILISIYSIVNKLHAQYYPAQFELSTLDGSNGFSIPAEIDDSRLGIGVSFIGDINNDGLEDVCIGASYANSNGLLRSGAAYVIFGSSNGFPSSFDLDLLDGTNGFVVEGIIEDERMGQSNCGPGDINGDGIDDLIVNSIAIYGSESTFPASIDENDIDGTNGFLININGKKASLGDVNGDGNNDFIISGRSFGPSGKIVFGRSDNFPLEIDDSWLNGTNGFKTNTFSNSSRPGYHVGGAGDINNDGYDDIMIGAWASDFGSNIPRSFVLFGKETFSENEDLESLDGSNGFSIDNAGNNFLTFVGPLGDINGDGIDDCFSENNTILGSEDPFPADIPMSSLDGSNGFVISDYVLCSAPLGDMNFDGVDDFIVAGDNQQIYVIFGTETGFEATFDASVLNGKNGFIIDDVGFTNIGRPISGDGDFNGDGLSDFIFGDDSKNSSTGEAYIVFGGDYYATLNNDYPKVSDITGSGFSLVANAPETGSVYYSIFPENYALQVDQEKIKNGTDAITYNTFAINTADTDIVEVITGLDQSTSYDVYLYFEDEESNESEVYKLDNITTTSACPYEVPCEERDALIALYNATDGPNWDNNTNWDTEEPVSSWYGIIIDNGHVTEIDLYSNGLLGTIPSVIENLPELTDLDLGNNNLSGTIPTVLGNLLNLTRLHINANQLTGSIPSSFSNLTNLTSLNVGSNQLTGSFPSFITDYSDLTFLSLYRNQFSGSIPTSIGNLTKLRYLSLSRNQLSGTIPSSLGNLVELTSLRLSENQLSGSIPVELGNLINLELLLLNRNELSGPIPNEIGNLINLTHLYLRDNQLTGSIPSTLGNLDKVEQLSLNDNNLSGSVPATFVNLTSLNQLYLWNNNLSGDIPDLMALPDFDHQFFIQNNAFQFGDFEDEFTEYESNISFFRYSPQAKVDSEITINKNIGESVTFSVNVRGNANEYQWYYDDSPIDGATSSSFTINNLQTEDAGTYHAVVTNTTVTNLAIVRHPIHLNVSLSPDTEAPSITCPGDQELACDEALPDYLDLATITDNQDPNPAVAQDPAVGSTFTDGMTITLTATDASGNESSCTFTVNEAADDEDPAITCPSDQELEFGANLPDYTDLATTSDNCDNEPNITQSPVAGSAFTDGMTITLTTTDDSDNTNSCSFVVNKAPDTEAPAIACPDNQELACDATVPDYTDLATVADNEDPNPTVLQSPDVGSTFTAGMTITLTATDASGNESSCTFTVDETADTEDPAITCPGDLELAAGASLPDYTDLATASDNCDNEPDITQSPVAGSAFTDGMTVTLTATDDNGNTTNCSFFINQTPDDEAPSITCPDDQQLACDAVLPDYTNQATATDNQDPDPTITQDPVAGTAVSNGMTITLTATDANGNESSCSFVVNVEEDAEAPSLTCPGDQTVICGTTTIPDFTDLATATDNCDGDPAITQSPAAEADFTDGMTVTLEATDQAGNTSSCSFIVHEASDDTPPTISCLDDQVITCGTQLPDYTDQVEASDQCDSAPIVTQSPQPGTVIVQNTTVTLTVTDNAGNETSCSFAVQTEADFTVDAGMDKEIFEGDTVQLEASSMESGDFIWDPQTNIIGQNTNNPITVAPGQSTTYTVTLKRADGCTATDEVLVNVAPDEGFKEKYGISPDGDGINETWQISGIEDYPDNVVSIFNKWGQLVYEVQDYDNDLNTFDGQANRLTEWGAGKLPEGTYYFLIQFPNGDHEKVKGFVMIKR